MNLRLAFDRRRSHPGALVALAATLLAAGAASGSESRWTFEGALGAAHSFRTPLMIGQTDEPELRFTARWRTRSFDAPIYYAGRIARAQAERAWAVELVHHKLHLENPPPEVERYEITHGFNLLTVNRLAFRGAWMGGAGLGVVIARPENRVRSLDLSSERGILGLGYVLAGPVASLTGGVRRPLGANLFAGLEGKLTAAYARVPVDRGWSSAPNVAVHVLFAIGWSPTGARATALEPAPPPVTRPDLPAFEP